jgi:hypothetical protein
VYDWVKENSMNSPDEGKEKKLHGKEDDLLFLDMDKCEREAPDSKLASYLWSYAEDFDEYELFEKKLNFVINVIECSNGNIPTGLERPTSDVPTEVSESYDLIPGGKQSSIVGEAKDQRSVKVVSTNISNSVYNYSLGKEVSLISLSTFLMKKGFNVDFHNWSSSQLKVAIVDDDEVQEFDDVEAKNQRFGTPRSETKSPKLTTSTLERDVPKAPKLAPPVSEGKAPKLKTHRFSLTRNLSIKQTSSTPYSKALKAHNTFMEGLEGFLESETRDYDPAKRSL